MAEININFKVSESDFKKSEKIFYKHGMDFNMAFYMFLQETGEYKKIPFEITVDKKFKK